MDILSGEAKRSDDYRQVAALAYELIGRRIYPKKSVFFKDIESDLDPKRIIIAYDQTRIAGFLIHHPPASYERPQLYTIQKQQFPLCQDPCKTEMIHMIGTVREYQGKGVASMLVDELISGVKTKMIPALTAVGIADEYGTSVPFFRKKGFLPLHTNSEMIGSKIVEQTVLKYCLCGKKDAVWSEFAQRNSV